MSAARTARIIGKGATAIAVVIILGIVALMLVPGLFGFDRYVITGGSMSGTFERGSVVLKREVPVAELRVGDIITYLPPADSGVTELVTHRILSISESPDGSGTRVFRTQGDANADADPWTFTLASATQPRVEGWVPAAGWVLIALSLPGVRMLVIGVPSAVIALLYLRDLLRAPGGGRARPTRTAAAVC